MAHPGGAAAEGGRIRRIDVRNFKSYKGEHAIGPFDDAMTSVIGPNGSGKSNLMDAISFVVGVKSAHLRSAQLSELVHTGETHAYVALVFVPPGANAAEIVFKRAIANGSATYSIDGKTVTAAAYLDMLASFGVLTKTRNFLVFQGDVEQVATRGPKELMAMFEHIGGADTLIPKYDELEASCASLEQESQYAHGKRKGIALEKRQKKEQRDEAEHYATLKEELAGLRGTRQTVGGRRRWYVRFWTHTRRAHRQRTAMGGSPCTMRYFRRRRWRWCACSWKRTRRARRRQTTMGASPCTWRKERLIIFTAQKFT